MAINYRGKRALIEYQGGAKEEKPFDSCKGAPIQILLGCGDLPSGIDEALMNMEAGEERIVEVPPEKGFGLHDPKGVRQYLRSFIKGGETLKVGDAFPWLNPLSEKRIPARVIDGDESSVLVDFNHPMAGKTLVYWLRLVKVID